MLREKEAQKKSLQEDMETVRKRKLAEQEMSIREERQKRQQEIEMERSASKDRRQQMLEEAERKEQDRIQQREDQEDKLQSALECKNRVKVKKSEKKCKKPKNQEFLLKNSFF